MPRISGDDISKDAIRSAHEGSMRNISATVEPLADRPWTVELPQR